MRIGIDARAASEVTGGRGRLVRELLRALAARGEEHEYVLYARTQWQQAPRDARFAWRLIQARAWHLEAARAANRECDVFLSTNSYLTPLLLRIPCVTLVYDLVAFSRAMQPNRRSMVIERFLLGAAVRRSRVLLCISEATRAELLERHPAARAEVALLASSLPRSSVRRDDGFVLAVGTLEPRKNLPRLVAAYASLPRELQERHRLSVVGASGWQTGETLTALDSLGERCERLGHVPDAELARLYGNCAVFCYPSLGEGFGLPVLEAMAAGAAVVTSDCSSLPEVGGDAVRYVDPHHTTSIAAGLRELLEDPSARALLGERVRVRAALFSWDEFAGRTLAALAR
ncbi:MAG: glycosyltransferase family 4 protein [Solirubrobacteraceae bacterium]